MILICYDGSDDAKAAVDRAAELMPGTDATVLTVWSPAIDVLLAPAGYPVYPTDHAEIDAASEKRAGEVAADGAERARSAGLTVESRARCRRGSVAGTMLDTAEEVGADAIVVGSRGLTGVKSVFLGSVSRDLLHDADRPVVVVPSEVVVERRSETRHPGAAVV